MTLYRKYRPQQFGDLVGQDLASTVLQQALIQDRLAHAYLFAGPRGTGKTSSARILARAANCLNPTATKTSFEPCNECENCQELINNATPDLTEIDAASNRGIDDMRDLREQVNYRPTTLKRKVYIIDEVHMLTVEAFNALLKTLEEPPSYCLFILATTELHKIPLTIRSRCQLLRFERGSTIDIEAKLRRVAKAEGISIDDEALTLLARYAEGGYRDAETLLESLAAATNGPLTAAAVAGALGAAPAEQVDTLLGAMLAGDRKGVLASLADTPASLERFISQLIQRLRDSLLEPGSTPLPSVQGKLTSYALSQLLEAYILHKNAPIPSLSLEIAALNVTEAASGAGERIAPAPEKPSKPVNLTVQAAVEAPVTTMAPAPQEAKVPVVEVELEADSQAVKDIRKAWKLTIDAICRENVFLGEALRDTVFHKVEGGTVTIHVKYKFHADKMREVKNAARIKGLLGQFTGVEWDVVYHVSDSLPKRHSKKELNASVDDAKDVFGA